jgi:hypothetical protein
MVEHRHKFTFAFRPSPRHGDAMTPDRFLTLARPATLALLALGWLWPLVALSGQLWEAHSLGFDALRLLGTVEAWQAGIVDARWFPSFDAGRGYPLLSFYAPLLYLLGAPLVAAGLGVGWALLLLHAGALALGTAGIMRLGTTLWRSPVVGWCAGMAWLAAPYAMVNVYVRAAGPEFLAMQLLPWVALGAHRLAAGGRAWLFVLATAAAVLSHNFLGMVAFGLALVWLAAATPEGMAVQTLRRGAGALGLVLALTAWWWLPIPFEAPAVRLAELQAGGKDHHTHFLHASNLLRLRQWGHGASLPGPDDTMALHLGWMTIPALLAVVAAAAAAFRRRPLPGGMARPFWQVLAGTVAAVLLTTGASALLWDHVKLLAIGQFPWRLLALASLGVALLAGALVPLGRHLAGPPGAFAAMAVIIGAAGLSFLDYDPIVEPRTAPTRIVPLDRRTADLRTALEDEYGPIWRPRWQPPAAPPAMPHPGPGVEVLAFEGNGARFVARLRVAAPGGSFAVSSNYFPGWEALVDAPGGRETIFGPAEGNGWLEVTGLPAGEYTVTFRLAATPARRAGRLVSAAALLGLLGLALRRRIRRLDTPRPPDDKAPA